MDIQHDVSSNSGLQTTQSYDFDLTTTIGQNKYPGLVVGVSIFGAGSVSSVSVEGVSLTLVTTNTHSSGNYRTEIWHLLAVPLAAGAITITVTLSGTLNSIAGASYYSYYGGTGFLEGQSGAGDAQADVVTTQPNSIPFAILATQTTSGVACWVNVHAINNRWDVPSASGTAMGGDKGPYAAVEETVQMGWTNIGVTDFHSIIVLELLSYIPAPPAIMGL